MWNKELDKDCLINVLPINQPRTITKRIWRHFFFKMKLNKLLVYLKMETKTKTDLIIDHYYGIKDVNSSLTMWIPDIIITEPFE